MEKRKYTLTELNKYGIKVVRACVSCKYGNNEINTTTCRCARSDWYGVDMKKNDICPSWRMKRELQRAGKGDGKVKKRKYLMDVLDCPSQIDELRIWYDLHKDGIYERM